MKIAVLYICTGKYTVFWDRFHAGCERFFLPSHQKEYFVFTDGELGSGASGQVHRVQQENLGWPGNTLMRFHMFSRVADQLRAFDLCFFFNANMDFVQTVGDEFLPTDEEGLLVVRHPGYCRVPYEEGGKLPYERRPESSAYVPLWHPGYYVCGGLNGGYTASYLELVSALRRAIDIDLEHNVVAQWHDESHLNRYILGRPCKINSPEYAFPEGWRLPCVPKIVILDKSRYGGHDFLRGK